MNWKETIYHLRWFIFWTIFVILLIYGPNGGGC